MKIQLKFSVNGQPYDIMIKPQRTLVEVLRNELGLTGTKTTCDGSACGMCTVMVDGMAVKSCSLLAMQVAGRQVTTIEGLAKNGQLHPIQQAFIEHGALQCGWCTPAEIMTAKALLDRNPNPTEDEVKREIQGVLCRCTGYEFQVEAIQAAAKAMRGGQR